MIHQFVPICFVFYHLMHFSTVFGHEYYLYSSEEFIRFHFSHQNRLLTQSQITVLRTELLLCAHKFRICSYSLDSSIHLSCSIRNAYKEPLLVLLKHFQFDMKSSQYIVGRRGLDTETETKERILA